MDFVSDQVKKLSDSKPEEPDHNKLVEGTETTNRPASSSELVASAKVVAEAANESDKLDKAKVAGASADILDDINQEYGKFDKSNAGQYFENVEKYLKDLESSGGAVVAPSPPTDDAPPLESQLAR